MESDDGSENNGKPVMSEDDEGSQGASEGSDGKIELEEDSVLPEDLIQREEKSEMDSDENLMAWGKDKA